MLHNELDNAQTVPEQGVITPFQTVGDYASGNNGENLRNMVLHDLMVDYGKDVWNLAFSITRRVDLADDVTQDVFLKTYRKIDSFQGHSSIKTWLLAITRNTAYDYRRSAFFRRVTLVEQVADRGSQVSAEHEAFEHIVKEELWQAALNLTSKLREVWVLYAHHQLSTAEISDVLGISRGTVRTRLQRARTKILAMYKGVQTDAKE